MPKLSKVKICDKVTTVVANPGRGTDERLEISYTGAKVIGQGTFGVVYRAKLLKTNKLVAIKEVLQNTRMKSRELQTLLKLNHCNIVSLKYYFYCHKIKKSGVFLNLVLEFIPETLEMVLQNYNKIEKKAMPMLYIKLYMYQVFRSLAYVHSLDICHRDIKPPNLLLDTRTGVLKLCDFGSAKLLKKGELCLSYICTRPYRAPELVLGARDYTTMIDVWSAGCVLAELMLEQPIFPALNSIDLMVKIVNILGRPTKKQIKEMNGDQTMYKELKIPPCKAKLWQNVFEDYPSPDAVDLVSCLLKYIPSSRLTPLQACAHKFFDELRKPGTRLLNNRELPPLFNFTEYELQIQPDLNSILIPPHLHGSKSPAMEDCPRNAIIAEQFFMSGVI